MHSHLVRFVLFSQLTFFGFLLVCTVLAPHYLFASNEGGISNFGVHHETVVPFTCALGGAAVFVMLAARATPRTTPSANTYATGLWTFGVLLLAVLFTTYPYQHGTVLKDLHIVVGSLTVAFEVVAATWLVAVVCREPADRAAWVLEVVGFALAALTLAGVLHVLFVSQLVTSAAFGFLLVRAAWQLGGTAAGATARTG